MSVEAINCITVQHLWLHLQHLYVARIDPTTEISETYHLYIKENRIFNSISIFKARSWLDGQQCDPK